MTEIIHTEKLTKYFGSVHAVEDLSISVRKGEIYGFLGLNGAGKTTTIRMLLGMIRPTRGVSYLNGKKVYSTNHELWNDVGYLVEIPFSYPDLSVQENLEIMRRLRFARNPAMVDDLMEKLKLGPYRHMKCRNLSLGNAQRLGIAKAILHRPQILMLDEPANGLDPAGIVEIRELLCDMAFNDGVTIFISSHILGEISRFATRIGIIHEGRLVKESHIEELNQTRHRCLQVRVHDRDGASAALVADGYHVTITEEGVLEITGKDALESPEHIASLLVMAGYPPKMLKVEEEDLESFFFRTINRKGGVS